MQDFSTISAAIVSHLEKHIGNSVENVYHQLLTVPLTEGGVPLEVLHIPPSASCDFHTLTTLGMSRRPMAVPDELAHFELAELMLALPKDWDPPTNTTLGEYPDDSDWPIHHLISLAQAIHQANSFLLWGIQIPNGTSATELESFTDNTPFFGSFIWHPKLFPESFETVVHDGEHPVNLLSVLCLFQDEVDLMMAMPQEEFVHLIENRSITELINENRLSLCANREK